jgi:hypothetical protein
VNDWINIGVNTILNELKDLNKPFKYVGTLCDL